MQETLSRSDDAAGLLPAAWYVSRGETWVPRRHRLLGFAVLAIALTVSLVLPVAGAIAVTGGIVVLRAVDRAAEAFAARRRARGPGVCDPLVVAMFMPWALGAAVVETVLLAPLALLAAAAVVAAARIAMGREHLALATATAAVAYTAVSCLGPRSRSPRRGLNRFLNAIAPTPSAAGRAEPGAATAAMPLLAGPGEDLTTRGRAAPGTPRPAAGRRGRRRFWAVKRFLGVAIGLALVGAIVFTGLVLVLPGVGDAPILARALDRAHDIAYPGSALPPRLAASLIVAGDHRSYSDSGIGPGAVGRMILGRLTAPSGQGGSPISQQLARMLYVRGRSGVLAEAEQILLGIKLDLNYSTAQLLQMYTDVAYFGHGYYGLATASCGYFAEPPDELSWGQAAMLAGLVQAPPADDPLSHFANARAREDQVLARLTAAGELTSAQAARAFRLPLHLAPGAQAVPGCPGRPH